MGGVSDNPFETDQWLTEHGDYLYRYAMMRLRNDEFAKDAVQETLLAAWQASERFQGHSSVRTWLVGILKHKITDHIRKQIRDRKFLEQEEREADLTFFDEHGKWRQDPGIWGGDPEQLAENQEFLQVLNSCMDHLPERQRDVFMLRELQGENTDTICNDLDISATNTHVILHRARLALRQCLEANWFGGASA